MALYEAAKALIEADPGAYVEDRFGQDQKLEMIVLYSADRRKQISLDRATRDKLCREGMIFARDEQRKEGFNLFTVQRTGPIPKHLRS